MEQKNTITAMKQEIYLLIKAGVNGKEVTVFFIMKGIE